MKKYLWGFLVTGAFVVSANAFALNRVTYDPDQYARFEATNECPGCDLTGKVMYGENHDNANLAQALLSRSSIDRSNYAKANFAGANLVELSAGDIMASGAIFTGADLSHAYFNNANLSRADFSNAILTGVNFADATLIQAKISTEQLNEASSLSCAIMPDGSRHAPDPNKSCD